MDNSLTWFKEFNKSNAHKTFYRESEIGIGCVTLGALSGLIGNIVKVFALPGFSVYPNLYTLVVGESGTSKSSYFSPIQGVIDEVWNEKIALYLKERERRERESQERKETNTPPDDSPYPDGTPDAHIPFISNDFTIEGALEDAATITDGNIFGFRDEFLSILNAAKSGRREHDIPFMNEAYEATSSIYSVRRKMKEAKIPMVRNLCMSMMGGLQIEGARRYFHWYKKNGNGDGFFARFQNIFLLKEKSYEKVPSLKSRYIPEKDEPMKQFVLKVMNERIHQKKLPYKHERVDQYNPYKSPWMLHLSPEALSKWSTYKLTIEKEQKTFGQMGAEHTRKTATFILKIAGLHHLLRWKDVIFTPQMPKEISLEDMEIGFTYAMYCLQDAFCLYNEKEDEDQDLVEQSDRFFSYVKNESKTLYQKYITRGWSLRDISRYNLSCLPRKSNKTVDEDALKMLLRTLIDEKKLIGFNKIYKGEVYTFYTLHPDYIEDKNHKETVEDLMEEKSASGDLLGQEEDQYSVRVEEDSPGKTVMSGDLRVYEASRKEIPGNMTGKWVRDKNEDVYKEGDYFGVHSMMEYESKTGKDPRTLPQQGQKWCSANFPYGTAAPDDAYGRRSWNQMFPDKEYPADELGSGYEEKEEEIGEMII